MRADAPYRSREVASNRYQVSNMPPVETLNYLLALGVLAMQIVGAGFLALYFLQKKFTYLQDIAALLSRWGLWLAFLLALGATAMTLYYSEVLGFAPCGWCWVQRVFLWPQVVLFLLALWKNDRTIADYSIALSILGALAALYQHYLQMVVLPTPPLLL